MQISAVIRHGVSICLHSYHRKTHNHVHKKRQPCRRPPQTRPFHSKYLNRLNGPFENIDTVPVILIIIRPPENIMTAQTSFLLFALFVTTLPIVGPLSSSIKAHGRRLGQGAQVDPALFVNIFWQTHNCGYCATVKTPDYHCGAVIHLSCEM